MSWLSYLQFSIGLFRESMDWAHIFMCQYVCPLLWFKPSWKLNTTQLLPFPYTLLWKEDKKQSFWVKIRKIYLKTAMKWKTNSNSNNVNDKGIQERGWFTHKEVLNTKAPPRQKQNDFFPWANEKQWWTNHPHTHSSSNPETVKNNGEQTLQAGPLGLHLPWCVCVDKSDLDTPTQHQAPTPQQLQVGHCHSWHLSRGREKIRLLTVQEKFRCCWELSQTNQCSRDNATKDVFIKLL